MIQINNNLGYTKLLSFKKGGLTSKIPDAKKKELFPYFAYLYSKQLNPEKYGSVASMEEWTNLIQNSKEDIDVITKAASQLTDDDWSSIAEQYDQAQSESSEQQMQFAKKGAKLKELQKGGKATVDSSEYFKKKMIGYSKMSETAGKNPSTTSKQMEGISNGLQTAGNNMLRQYKKGKEGFDKNGFPIKKQEKGGSVKKKRKCSCGCDLVISKDKGGKLTSKCACNCKGGKMKKK